MAKKRKKASLPKRLAGVKIPKKVRKGRLGALLASPLGQELLAGSVAVAGGALAARKAKHSPEARRLAGRLKHAGEDRIDETEAAAGLFAHALGEAARSFAEALQSGGRREPDWTGERDERPTTKKKSSYTPSPGL